jgi:hypothetical protein
MQRRLTNMTVKVGLPVLVGQFLFDWISSHLRSALSHLPIRVIVVFAVLLLWAAFTEHRARKKRTFREPLHSGHFLVPNYGEDTLRRGIERQRESALPTPQSQRCTLTVPRAP